MKKSVAGSCVCGARTITLSEMKSESSDVIRNGYAKLSCVCGTETPFIQCLPNWMSELKSTWEAEQTKKQNELDTLHAVKFSKFPTRIRNVVYIDVVVSRDRRTGETYEEVVGRSQGQEIVREEWLATPVQPEVEGGVVERRRVRKG